MVLFGLVFIGLVRKVVYILWCIVVLCMVCLNRNIWLVRFIVLVWVKLIFSCVVLDLWISVFMFSFIVLQQLYIRFRMGLNLLIVLMEQDWCVVFGCFECLVGGSSGKFGLVFFCIRKNFSFGVIIGCRFSVVQLFSICCSMLCGVSLCGWLVLVQQLWIICVVGLVVYGIMWIVFGFGCRIMFEFDGEVSLQQLLGNLLVMVVVKMFLGRCVLQLWENLLVGMILLCVLLVMFGIRYFILVMCWFLSQCNSMFFCGMGGVVDFLCECVWVVMIGLLQRSSGDKYC